VSEAAPPFCRVEVEVADGAIKRVQRFVDVFRLAARLKPGRGSKFEAGLPASGLRPLTPALELHPVAVNRGMTAAEAGVNVLRQDFAVLLANDGGTRLGEDIEALHDMRVPPRRLRAAMSAFR